MSNETYITEAMGGDWLLLEVLLTHERLLRFPSAVQNRVEWFKGEAPKRWVFDNSANGRVRLYPLSLFELDMLEIAADDTLARAVSQTKFRSNTEGKFTIPVPRPAIANLLTDDGIRHRFDAQNQTSFLIWMFAGPQDLELWSEKFRQQSMQTANQLFDHL